jgi:hypothetical protein
MTVERTNDEVIVRLSAAINVEELQRVLNYLTYKEVTATSEATQEEADQLARDLKEGQWAASRKRIVK